MWVYTWLACSIGLIFANQLIAATISELHCPFNEIHVCHAKAIVNELIALKVLLAEEYFVGRNLNNAHLDRNFPSIYWLLMNAVNKDDELPRGNKKVSKSAKRHIKNARKRSP